MGAGVTAQAEAKAYLETLGFVEVNNGGYRFMRCRDNNERLKVLLDLWRNRKRDEMSHEDQRIVKTCIDMLWIQGRQEWRAKRSSKRTTPA